MHFFIKQQNIVNTAFSVYSASEVIKQLSCYSFVLLKVPTNRIRKRRMNLSLYDNYFKSSRSSARRSVGSRSCSPPDIIKPTILQVESELLWRSLRSEAEPGSSPAKLPVI